MERFLNHIHQVASAQRLMPSFALEPWRPAVNVYETGEAVVIIAELAGIDPEKTIVQLEPKLLVIQGQRPGIIPKKVQKVHQLEIWSEPFLFEVSLPRPIDPKQIQASYRDGLLEIQLLKQGTTPLPPLTVRINLQGESLS
ncbi:MAG: Hsp20/alpha crystallin family protein [Pleurocapsa sp. MO_192.B19]|nr:Hsp20/alpha crystallin family protein [Pleurocapsa sp. MO_192.B19]